MGISTTGISFPSTYDEDRVSAQRYEELIKLADGKIYGIDFCTEDLKSWPTIIQLFSSNNFSLLFLVNQ